MERLLGEGFTLTTGRPGNGVRRHREYINITPERYAVEDFAVDQTETHVYGAAGAGSP